ncbi:hypothetical protein CI109_104077 [Kwoniella shandongensis]|uniref:Mitochondrial genome maintenance protein MGM101 n=1 Tax=Kwoniella shandongensis TaxID=1734106 RepID=A0A5M6C2N2_9TREE|nr:uncharacterized protein CI109_004037 [Kwoniella shandongensis]KAA5527499.1 hypothetical protein CI109_004037 [Kwoniella shandongensis]
MPFLLSTTLRRTSSLASSSSFVRNLTTSTPLFAAAATVPRTYVRKTPTKPTSTSAPARPAAAARPILDDFPDDFPILPSEQSMVEDYAHLSKPVATPPLTDLPDANYTPLPTISNNGGTGNIGNVVASQGIPGEVPAPVGGKGEDWSVSFAGLSERPFDKEVAEALLRPLSVDDVEVKPDGLLYLPEIKYRRTLNAAFGPGGWGLAPRGETHVGTKIVSREWGLVCLGRLVAIARGEQEFFDPSGIATATEACKSNALMRCCKDLGIASELWDPSFIRAFKKKHCVEVFVEHVTKKNKKKLWRKKDAPKFDYPWKET